jgi:hypothetical protein
VYVLDKVLQPVGARCHIRRIDCQQHEAETYHLVWNKLSQTGVVVAGFGSVGSVAGQTVR